MSKILVLTVTKTVELSDCSEMWQLSEDQIKETLLNDWDDWDSVEVSVEKISKEEQDD